MRNFRFNITILILGQLFQALNILSIPTAHAFCVECHEPCALRSTRSIAFTTRKRYKRKKSGDCLSFFKCFNSSADDNQESLQRSKVGEGVPSTPCTRICRYNANIFDGQVCIGCFRETFEISQWQSMKPIEKYYALLDAIDRLEEVSGKKTTGNCYTIDESTTGTSREELLRQAEYWKRQ